MHVQALIYSHEKIVDYDDIRNEVHLKQQRQQQHEQEELEARELADQQGRSQTITTEMQEILDAARDDEDDYHDVLEARRYTFLQSLNRLDIYTKASKYKFR